MTISLRSEYFCFVHNILYYIILHYILYYVRGSFVLRVFLYIAMRVCVRVCTYARLCVVHVRLMRQNVRIEIICIFIAFSTRREKKMTLFYYYTYHDITLKMSYSDLRAS